MLKGFILGLLLWAGPAVLTWLLVGPLRLNRHFRHHH